MDWLGFNLLTPDTCREVPAGFSGYGVGSNIAHARASFQVKWNLTVR